MPATRFPKRSRIAPESGQAGLVLVVVLGLILLIGFAGYKYLESTGMRLYESSETMDRGLRHLTGLEYMHPFAPPRDGAVPEERAAVFEAVTTEAYGVMKGDLRKLNDLDTGGDDPSLREGAADGIHATDCEEKPDDGGDRQRHARHAGLDPELEDQVVRVE